MPADELTPESYCQRPDVVRAVENPRSPRSVLNYMCGCDTVKPEIRESLNQDETVRPLMTIWFQSGRTLDALVGVGGLEQTVYIALTDGNVGEGLIAGLAMAVIAIIAERMTNG